MRGRSQRRKTGQASTVLQQILAQAASEDPRRYQNIVQGFHGKVAHVFFEDSNETFYVRGEKLAINVVKREPANAVNLSVILSRPVIGDILRGQETPVEAFFLGHLRAQGLTEDLYQLHRLFIAMAEIAVRSEQMRAIVEELTKPIVPEG